MIDKLNISWEDFYNPRAAYNVSHIFIDLNNKLNEVIDKININQKELTFEQTKEGFLNLTDEQRLEIIRERCVHCGDLDPSCRCWGNI